MKNLLNAGAHLTVHLTATAFMHGLRLCALAHQVFSPEEERTKGSTQEAPDPRRSAFVLADDPVAHMSAVYPDFPDAVRYAASVITLGPHPDSPEDCQSSTFVRPGGMCLVRQAEYLREIADLMEAQHTNGVCS